MNGFAWGENGRNYSESRLSIVSFLMSRKRQSEHNFLFYRAQFRGELPLITSAIEERAEFLKAVLESAAQKRATLRGLRWRVGNLAIYPTKGQTLLYGRIGKLSYRLIEHYAPDELAFKIIELPEDHSVSFVFQSEYEYVAIEESSNVSAESAGKNLVRLFNSVPSNRRNHYSLELPPIDDFETAFQKLKTLKSITRFRAMLRRPNPELEDVWREFYRNLDEGSGADSEIVEWKSEKGGLNPEASTPIGKAIQMISSGYGRWEARGRTMANKVATPKSGANIVTRQVGITTLQEILDGAAHWFSTLHERMTGSKK